MAFATVTDLESRLGRTFTTTETVQVVALLDDATAHLRSIIGAQVSPPATVTVRHLVDGAGWVAPPAYPATLVSALVNGEAFTIDPLLVVDARLWVNWGCGYADTFGAAYGHGVTVVDATYSLGYTTVPPELTSWCCVLTSQALAQIAQGGAIGAAGVESERIDDYAVNFTTSGEGASAFFVPQMAAEQLRARFGTGAYVTTSR